MADKVAGLLFKIAADTKALRQGFKKTQTQVSSMKKSFSALGPIIAGAFSVRVIGGFTKEIVKLAGEAEGVEEAFSRLKNSEQLIKDLTEATRGTVTQLQLMKYAVQAKNFKIPLDKLATYFEFATKRAAQTGESVDYLVNSLITGVGRKSVLVMDNLGISAVALQEEVKKVGDFGLAAGNIIERELGNMGDVSKTTAQEVQTLAAMWEDVKKEIGQAVIETSNFKTAMGKLTEKLSGTDWSTTMDNIIDGFREFYEYIILLNPALTSTLILIDKLRNINLGGDKKTTGVTGQSFYNMLLGATSNVPGKSTKVTDGGTGGAKKKVTPGPGIKGARFGISGQTNLFGGQANVMQGLFGMSGKGAGQFDLSGMISQVEQRASKLATTVREKVAPAMVGLGIVVQQAFAQAVDAMGNFIEGLFAGTLNLEDGLQKVLAVFGGFMVQMGKMIAAYGVAMLAMDLASVNPVAAIAAGLALVAIGSAIKGLASRGPAVGGASMGRGASPAMQPVQVVGKISGSNILLASERAAAQRSATT
jgi:hypothetical protein